MATKRSTMGPRKDSVPAKQFNDPLWARKDETTSVKQWTCEEAAKRVAAIEGMPDNGTLFIRSRFVLVLNLF